MTSAGNLPHACDAMVRFTSEPRVPIRYNPRFREYSLELIESEARQLIAYCPWCGQALPSSVRDRFFVEMERLGIDYPSDEPPAVFRDDQWWRDLGER